MSEVLTTTAKVEAVVNALAPIAAAVVPGAAPVVADVQAAETVANAVEGNLAHHTAADDVAVALGALANTAAVQKKPAAASWLSEVAALFKEGLALVGVK